MRGEDNALTTVTFMNDGRYLLVEGSEQRCQVRPRADPGVEFGTYEWNSTSGGPLTTQVAEGSETLLTDTNGDWGLSDPQGTMTMVIEGDTALFTESGGDPADSGTTLQRLTVDADTSRSSARRLGLTESVDAAFPLPSSLMTRPVRPMCRRKSARATLAVNLAMKSVAMC